MAAAGVPWLVPAFMANFPTTQSPPVHPFSDPDPNAQSHHLPTPFDIAEYLLNMDDDGDIGDAIQQQQQQQPLLQQQQLSPVMQGGSSSSNTWVEGGIRVAFRTKSEVEILDDGFKWRKYGKKSVKNNSHPRNYYRCSTEGCSVKKRVERDREDPSYVITTYDGVHNHTSPSVIYDTMRDDTSGQFLVSGCQMRSTP